MSMCHKRSVTICSIVAYSIDLPMRADYNGFVLFSTIYLDVFGSI